TIGVDTAVGKGSTFWVELQQAESPVHRARGTRATPSEDGSATAGPSRTLLYVEDNLANLKLLERILEPRPEINLLTAMQGQVGLELAREHQPDLILLDLQLPDVSGVDVLRKLKAGPTTRDIPVVVVSADATDGQVNRVLKEGAAAYLSKPLNVREFLRVLEQHADGRPSRDRDRPQRSASA
ncbi:MAG TPA: response regulator, partial [Actinomycetota bacterium]|nr:response regulator [Actinomycetota bacterium]